MVVSVLLLLLFLTHIVKKEIDCVHGVAVAAAAADAASNAISPATVNGPYADDQNQNSKQIPVAFSALWGEGEEDITIPKSGSEIEGPDTTTTSDMREYVNLPPPEHSWLLLTVTSKEESESNLTKEETETETRDDDNTFSFSPIPKIINKVFIQKTGGLTLTLTLTLTQTQTQTQTQTPTLNPTVGGERVALL